MVLAYYVDFDVWVGGVIEWVPTIRYVGGIRVLLPNADKERLYYGHLLEMYAKARGKGLNTVIHYCLPGHTLDNGIKMLDGDEGIRELLRDYKGLSVPPQPAQRPETTQPPSNNNVQAPSQTQSTLQPSQKPMQHVPRRRKQSAPVSKSAKMQKMAEGTGINIQRECCSSTRPTLSPQLKRISSSYRPGTVSSSSKGEDASGRKIEKFRV
ncbi:hypothetical protein Salat_2393100 [Sesamum alatum]|uniref:Uncharacterized protein n=1 Tax=Sesamum alatum TaxID=300844 RepID=A0AAE1XY98_9LAMI|nr:hypothetical protein Salat_2393100 [Sesamum alatum]